MLCGGKHEFLRVKLGEGAGLERRQAARALERYLDAVSVHEVGFTVTLYREKGLPRPSNVPAAPAPVALIVEERLPALEASALPMSVPKQRTSAKAAERAVLSKAEAKKQQKGPPEISVVR